MQEDSIKEIEVQENIKKKPNTFLWIVVFILFITNILTIVCLFYYINKSVGILTLRAKKIKPQEVFSLVKVDKNGTEEEKDIVLVDEKINNNKDQKMATNQEASLGEEILLIEWNKKLENIESEELFKNTETEKIYNENKDNWLGDYEEFLDKFSIKETGRVASGIYVGGRLYNIIFRPEGPAFRDIIYRVIKKDSEIVILSKHSDWIDNLSRKIFVVNDISIISGLNLPDSISIPNTEYRLYKDDKIPLFYFKDAKYLFNYGDIKVYKNGHCFIGVCDDSTMQKYRLGLDFVQEKEDNSSSVSVPHSLNIVWKDGKKNNQDYSLIHIIGGCGGELNFCHNYPDYIKDINQLKQSGKTIKGDIIYELKDINLKANLDDGVTILKTMYKASYLGREKKSFKEFLADHPIIYWQDPFGDFIEFRNAGYQPMVECGKPIIYLYPEEEMDVQVLLEPSGGFTLTEPDYGSGWKVKASPNGELYNYANKKIYPYLFWEGYANKYYRPEKGFVVEREKVKEFLVEKLALLGLIENEYNEFIEFWLPRMQDKPYYYITFMNQADFNKIAPLKVSPRPNKIIRVFMDYEGIDNYIEVEEQTIVATKREGFTVVEWGGALHK